jgi:hypothetical protein
MIEAKVMHAHSAWSNIGMPWRKLHTVIQCGHGSLAISILITDIPCCAEHSQEQNYNK